MNLLSCAYATTTRWPSQWTTGLCDRLFFFPGEIIARAILVQRGSQPIDPLTRFRHFSPALYSMLPRTPAAKDMNPQPNKYSTREPLPQKPDPKLDSHPSREHKKSSLAGLACVGALTLETRTALRNPCRRRL